MEPEGGHGGDGNHTSLVLSMCNKNLKWHYDGIMMYERGVKEV